MANALSNPDISVELFKQAHTAQLAQQAGAADIRYLTVDAGRDINQFDSLNTRQTEMIRLERIVSSSQIIV